MRRAAKVDGNQPQIVAGLRLAGYHVETTHQIGGGVPDLVVSKGALSVWVEVKMPGEELNEKQKQWHSLYFVATGRWPLVVYSLPDALRKLAALMGEEVKVA